MVTEATQGLLLRAFSSGGVCVATERSETEESTRFPNPLHPSPPYLGLQEAGRQLPGLPPPLLLLALASGWPGQGIRGITDSLACSPQAL